MRTSAPPPAPALPEASRLRRVTVLSGFLGSGKSTLLRAHLGRVADGPAPGVVVNDFAATTVDEVPGAAGASTTMLTGGCICCTRREDLSAALLATLEDGSEAGRPGHDVLIETSGLSDPGPIAFTVRNDPVLKHHFALAEIWVTVDAVAGLANLERHPVARRQLLAADRVFLTKSDLTDPQAVDRLVAEVRALNTSATVTVTAAGEVVRELAPRGPERSPAAGDPGTPETSAVEHVDSVATMELVTDRALDWQAFSVWLSLLLFRHGPQVLRVKGVLDVEHVGPVALNGVQHVVHPPEHLDGPVGSGTRLVLITQGLDPALLERSFHTFVEISRKEAGS